MQLCCETGSSQPTHGDCHDMLIEAEVDGLGGKETRIYEVTKGTFIRSTPTILQCRSIGFPSPTTTLMIPVTLGMGRNSAHGW